MFKKVFHGLLLALFALWWGGFTFYASFVVPTGMQILGNHTNMGMITQSVTNYLNGIGTITLLFTFGNSLMNIRPRKSFLRKLGWEWFCLVSVQAFLYYYHNTLSRMILLDNQEIKLANGFYNIHRVYLLLSTGVWMLVPVHFYKVRKSIKYINE